MTWSLSTQRHSYCLRLHNLPPDVTATALAQFFWEKVGMNLGVECFDITRHGCSANALAAIPRASLADFIERLVSEQRLDGKQIIVRPNWVPPIGQPNEGRENELTR